MAIIRTIYEVSKPAQQFYSVERAGYTSLNTAAYQVVNDMLQLGSFTIANVNYKATGSGTLTGGRWPISERVYSLSLGGSGYNTGDQISVVGGAFKTQPFTATVTSVRTETRGNQKYSGERSVQHATN